MTELRLVATTAALGGALGLLGWLILSGDAVSPPGRVVGPTPGPGPLHARRCPRKGTRLLVIGDSYAHGLAPYLAQLAGPCGVPYHRKAIVGSSALQWQHEDMLREAIERSDPNVVLVSLGGNDLQKPHAQLRAAIQTLVGKLRKVGATVLWIEPLVIPVAETSGARQLWKSAVGPGHWFDSPGFDARVGLERAPDRIHLRASGYRAWAKAIWHWMVGRTGT